MFVGDLFGRRLASRNARVIDEDVDAPVAGRQLIGDLGHTAGVRDVQDGDFGVQALGFQACTPGTGKLGVAIRDHDLRPRLRQGFRAGKSYSLTGAGHNGGFLVQFEFFQIHLPVVPLFAYRGQRAIALMF